MIIEEVINPPVKSVMIWKKLEDDDQVWLRQVEHSEPTERPTDRCLGKKQTAWR